MSAPQRDGGVTLTVAPSPYRRNAHTTTAFSAAPSAFARALAAVNENADDWEKQVIDQAILHRLDMYGSVSANDFRDLLPEITNRNLIGARVNAIRIQQRLRKMTDETSTDAGTHGKPIGRWCR